MEKFELDEERSADIFSSFVGKAKIVLTTLIENIKTNIKNYEIRIEDTTKEIEDNEISREKCVHEITKMENRITDIKDSIENVENTYKRIVDAYSSTSKGETKELYSEIIDGAKANCEKEVEKNRSEIARLNSDIEAIKNNISEFTKIIDELNRNLDAYNLELYKYSKALEYMNKMSEQTNDDLNEISNKREVPKKNEKNDRNEKNKKNEDKKVEEVKPSNKNRKKNDDDFDDEIVSRKNKRRVVEDIDFEPEDKETSQEEVKPKSEIDESLKQIFDLTGYTPKSNDEPVEPIMEEEVEEEPLEVVEDVPVVPEEPVVEEKKVYTDNLEDLFSNPLLDDSFKPEVQEEVVPVQDGPVSPAAILDSDFSSWEQILNAPTDELGGVELAGEAPQAVQQDDSAVNQLLMPYGTDYNRLCSLVSNQYTHRDGTTYTFNMTVDDVMSAVNAIDGTDLKMMKTVGPEITLLRKIKNMKEGNL